MECFLLSLEGSVQGQDRQNIIAFQSSGTNPLETLVSAGDLVNAFIAHGQATWLAMFPPSYFLNRISARRATPKPSAVAHLQYDAFAEPGTFAGATVSYNLCPSLFLVPPMGTKTGGRIFLPCVPALGITNNSYNTSWVTAVNAWTTAAISGYAGTGTSWQLAIYSRRHRTFQQALFTHLSDRIGFQGRRRKSVGSA